MGRGSRADLSMESLGAIDWVVREGEPPAAVV
jgi:hypothetical protein